jgi:hypothetical protein
MRVAPLLLCLLVTLSACTAHQRPITPDTIRLQPTATYAVVADEASTPMARPTVRPLAALPVEDLLFQPGDFPAEVRAEPLDHAPPYPLEEKAPTPDRALAQVFKRESSSRDYGAVHVWWFALPDGRDAVYRWLAEDDAAQPVEGVGKRATLRIAQSPWSPGELTITICRAVVAIRLARLDDDGQELLAYGRRLVQRLAAVDCGGAAAVPVLPERRLARRRPRPSPCPPSAPRSPRHCAR